MNNWVSITPHIVITALVAFLTGSDVEMTLIPEGILFELVKKP